MGEDAKLFINKGIRIMVGDKSVGFAKEGMLTYSIEDDGSTKDSGAYEMPMHHSYEITGEAVVTNVGDPIRELLNDMPRKVDVEIRREMGKMPRKMKKACRMGDRYQRDTKWKRKAKSYEHLFIYRLSDAEIVIANDQMGVIEAIIMGSSLQYNTDSVAHVSGNDIKNENMNNDKEPVRQKPFETASDADFDLLGQITNRLREKVKRIPLDVSDFEFEPGGVVKDRPVDGSAEMVVDDAAAQRLAEVLRQPDEQVGCHAKIDGAELRLKGGRDDETV